MPTVVPLIAAAAAGLIGTFNAILLSFDPSVVGVVFWPHWRKKQQGRLQQDKLAARRPSTPTTSTQVLGGFEMAETKHIGDETQVVVVTTIHVQNAADRGLELYGPDAIDLENGHTSTLRYDMSHLADIYHGL